MIYSRTDLDDNFKDLIVKKTKRIKDMYSSDYQNKIKIDELQKVGLYFVDLKPQSKMRKYKKLILNYLDKLISVDKELSNRDLDNLMNTYLSSVFGYLRHNHGFLLNKMFLYIGLYGFIIDIILYMVGIGRYYHYIPIFTILFIFIRFIKERKAKRIDKLIDI